MIDTIPAADAKMSEGAAAERSIYNPNSEKGEILDDTSPGRGDTKTDTAMGPAPPPSSTEDNPDDKTSKTTTNLGGTTPKTNTSVDDILPKTDEANIIVLPLWKLICVFASLCLAVIAVGFYLTHVLHINRTDMSPSSSWELIQPSSVGRFPNTTAKELWS
jgi:hypothetical protein